MIEVDSPTRWHRADALLADALEQPAAARETFVDEACRGDRELRDAVRALLDADAEASKLLATGRLAEGPLPDAAPSFRIGPYTTLCELGRGGSAVVYLAARDDDVARRLVALKLIRRRDSNADLVASFRRERQILAGLEHPNIARMYDGGTTDNGDLYLVMELVDGMPIDAYCETHRLPIEDRLDLFLDVCSAVQHAHRSLLVHRDVKPGNILVTTSGIAKLLDFGIAKPLAADPLAGPAPTTRPHLRAMTPRYASPEQIAGGAMTVQSDVYSLGVVLYELLTGRSPYRSRADRLETLVRAVGRLTPETPSRAARRQPPELCRAIGGLAPARLARRLRGDLDTVVMKALRKRPRNRYASVEQMADDVRRHLALRPLVARPLTPFGRGWRLLRRHPRGSLAAGLALAILIAFGAALADRTRARDAALVAAEQGRSTTRRAIAMLTDLFQAAGVDSGLGKDVGARAVIDYGAERIVGDLTEEPLLRATLEDALGQVYLGFGDQARARQLLTRSYRTRLDALGPDSPETTATRHHLANAERDAGHLEVAENHLLAVHRTRLSTLGPAHADTARTVLDLASTVRLAGRPDEARVLYQQARDELPAIRENSVLLADVRTGLGLALLEAGALGEAEKELRAALELYQEKLFPGHTRRVDARGNVGRALNRQGRFAEAESHLRHALADAEGHLDDDHPSVVTTLAQLAISLSRQGKDDQAEPLFLEVVDQLRTRLGDDHPGLARALNNLAAFRWQHQGEPATAIPLLEEATAIRQRAFGEQHDSYALSLVDLGHLQLATGDPERALDAFVRSLAVLERNHGRDHLLVSRPLAGIAGIHVRRGEHEAALEPLTRALALRRRSLGEDHWQAATLGGHLGASLTALGHYARAEPLLLHFLDVTTATFGGDHPDTAYARTLLAELYEAWSRPADAARYRDPT